MEMEMEAAAAWAWARAAEARGQATTDPAWPEMPKGVEPAETVVEPPMEKVRDPEPADDDSEVEEIVVDTPPQNNVAERAKEGRTGDDAPGGVPEVTPACAQETTRTAEKLAGRKRALVVSPPKAVVNPEQAPGSGPAAGSQQALAGSDEVIFGPRTQEEVAMDAMH